MLAFGAMNHGGPYWCYVAVKPGRYDEFQAAMQSKKYDMQRFEKDEFGEVIVSGEGVVPPGDVTRQVAEMFAIPISQLFQDTSPKKTIMVKLEELNKNNRLS